MSCNAQRYMHGSKSDKVPKYTILARPSADRVSGDVTKTNCSSDALPANVPSSLLTNSSKSDNSDPSSCQLEQPALTANNVSRTLTGPLSNGDGQQLNVNINISQSHLQQKTPVCRINDLARFNKIVAQFVLVAEEGPPHKKTFYMQLTLGDEVFHDSAESLKKAQHSVASMALERTRYPHPPTKCLKQQQQQHQQQQAVMLGARSNSNSANESVNVLYVVPSTSSVSYSHNSQPLQYCNNVVTTMVTNDNDCCRPAGGLPSAATSDCVVQTAVCVSTETNVVVTDTGPTTPQCTDCQSTTTSNGCTVVNSDRNTSPASNDITPAASVTTGGQQYQLTTGGLQYQLQSDDCRLQHKIEFTAGRQTVPKSVINEVQELAVKMGLLVTYDIVEETPAPNFSYTIKCSCGSSETHGEGSNKKAAKKNAAELMLAELQTLAMCVAPSLDATPKKIWQKKKRPKNTVVRADDVIGTTDNTEQNHVGLLMHLQQTRKGSQPVYKDVGLRGTDFIVEVYVDTFMCIGFGRTKKLAKRDAAEKMLNALTVDDASPNINNSQNNTPHNTPPPPAKSALKRANSTHSAEKKVTFCEPDTVVKHDVKSSSTPIAIPKSHTVFPKQFSSSPTSETRRDDRTEDKPVHRIRVLQRPQSAANQVPPTNRINQVPAMRTEDKALAADVSSPPNDCVPVSPVHLPTDILLLSPVERLQSTVTLLHANFQFTDLPKASGSKEYLSMVMISTDPPQITHGVGSCLESAHDDASMKALLMLEQLGFVVQPTVSKEIQSAS